MKTIEQTYSIAAPVQQVWQALTDASVMEQWGAGPANSDIREGGSFGLWGGDIHGIYTKLIPEQLIEQDWYGHDHPDWKYQVVFNLTADGARDTTLHMIYSGDIQDEQKDISDWNEYYFAPIKKLLEQ
ncbi:MAG TPA: SRPBCC domain-containing protein [Candidatus Saccharimonadales bacterium]|nr:SRPBCC domain-containing protein [Candidatus Saccharimonadales bacterium]